MTNYCPDGFWCLQFKDILSALILAVTMLVIYFGPLKASSFSDKASQRNETRRRKMEILTALMKTRRVFLAPEHVMALNVIQLEFKDDAKVIKAYTDYIRLRNTQRERADERCFDEVNSVFFDMVHAIGEHLGLSFDKSDLESVLIRATRMGYR